MKKFLFVSVLILTTLLITNVPRMAISGGIPDSYIKFHQHIDSSLTMFMKKQGHFTTLGSVRKPEALTALGFTNVNTGQKIEVTEIEKNRWQVKNRTTGEQKIVEFQPDPLESFLKQFPRKAKR